MTELKTLYDDYNMLLRLADIVEKNEIENLIKKVDDFYQQYPKKMPKKLVEKTNKNPAIRINDSIFVKSRECAESHIDIKKFLEELTGKV